jgi:hypothetical protein
MNVIILIEIIVALVISVIAGLAYREFTYKKDQAIFEINFTILKRLILESTVTRKNFNLIRLEFSTLVSDIRELNRVKELDSLFREKFAKFIKQEVVKSTSDLQLRIANKIIALESDISQCKESAKKVVQNDPEEFDRLRRMRVTFESNLSTLKSLL